MIFHDFSSLARKGPWCHGMGRPQSQRKRLRRPVDERIRELVLACDGAAEVLTLAARVKGERQALYLYN